MKLLLHHCCAPCSPMAVTALQKDFEINSFWFNPNIQPSIEYENRKSAFMLYAQSLSLPVYFGPQENKDIWTENKDKENRCRGCYALRLKETALMAKELSINSFSTTLLSSPYQKHDLVRELGLETAKIHGLEFVYKDFRNSYYQSKDIARKAGLYIQKYCGCMPSKVEREQEKLKGKIKIK